jgi:FKBP-type peptidyl-prolyl cis-trans isomerase
VRTRLKQLLILATVFSLVFAVACKDDKKRTRDDEDDRGISSQRFPWFIVPSTRKNAPPENVAAPPTNAETTDSGLASIVLTKGEGTVRPGSTSTVMVHYTGWTTDGKMFDTSSKRGKPAEFRLNEVIPGWTEGLQLMVAGEKRRFWIPAELAYGENPSGVQPAGMLCFDIELLEFK